ncbi:Secreted protein OS=Streptomyces glaucescens OX=1907 GN=SGLAU_30815 PE=4 SV=1 [Streptomyces glaucescens]
MAGAAAIGVHRARSGPSGDDRAHDRWLTVTVNRPAEEVRPGGRLPTPLRAFDERIEVDVRPAPGDRGTELAVRLEGSHRAAPAPRCPPAGSPVRTHVRTCGSPCARPRPFWRPVKCCTPTHHRRPARHRAADWSAVVRRSGGEGVL